MNIPEQMNEVIEMTNKNIENIVKIDEETLVLDDNTLYEINGETYSLNELIGFIKASQELSRKVGRQSTFIEALKINNGKLTVERNKLCDRCMEQSRKLQEVSEENQSIRLENDFLQKELSDIKEMSMFEFGNRYCSSESLEADGHAFARSLGVGQ